MRPIELLHGEIRECERCALHNYRERAVLDAIPSVGVRVMLVGEAPGGHEATCSGRPFSGQAGRLLEDFLTGAGLQRRELYVTNLVKCRPVKPSKRPRYGCYANRAPRKGEIRTCTSFLERELAILSPDLVVTLGRNPLEWFAQSSLTMSRCSGRLFRFAPNGPDVYPMYHPASLIYNPKLKQTYQEDMRRLAELIRVRRKDST